MHDLEAEGRRGNVLRGLTTLRVLKRKLRNDDLVRLQSQGQVS